MRYSLIFAWVVIITLCVIFLSYLLPVVEHGSLTIFEPNKVVLYSETLIFACCIFGGLIIIILLLLRR